MSAARNLTPWQPGQSGNPSGRPRLPDELRAIRALTSLEVCKLVSKYARMSFSELEALLESKSIPVIELTIASIFAKAFESGDFTRLSFLLDRAIGKVAVMEESDEDKAARKEIEDLSDGELLRLVVAKIPELTAKSEDEPT